MAEQTSHGSGRASSQGNKASPGNRRVAQWTRGYARLPGIPDEYLAQDGTPRAVWSRFFDAFAELTPAEADEKRGRRLREEEEREGKAARKAAKRARERD